MLEQNANVRITPPVRTSKIKAANKNMTRRMVMDLYLNDIVYREERERKKGHENLQAHIMDYLSEVEHENKLPTEYLNVLHHSIKEDPRWDPMKGYNAFMRLEKFGLNLLDRAQAGLQAGHALLKPVGEKGRNLEDSAAQDCS